METNFFTNSKVIMTFCVMVLLSFIASVFFVSVKIIDCSQQKMDIVISGRFQCWMTEDNENYNHLICGEIKNLTSTKKSLYLRINLVNEDGTKTYSINSQMIELSPNQKFDLELTVKSDTVIYTGIKKIECIDEDKCYEMRAEKYNVLIPMIISILFFTITTALLVVALNMKCKSLIVNADGGSK